MKYTGGLGKIRSTWGLRKIFAMDHNISNDISYYFWRKRTSLNELERKKKEENEAHYGQYGHYELYKNLKMILWATIKPKSKQLDS